VLFLRAPTKANSKKRILLVDDEEGFTRLVQVNLERTGRYIVREENDPTNAVETAAEFQPDLILLDLVMPKMDGPRLSRQIQNDPRLKETRIMFLTGSIARNAAGATEIGGIVALAKPIGITELMEAIEAMLAGPVTRSHHS
jgi:CheY-like chemotaxis protein